MKDKIFHLKGDIIRVKEIMDALAYTLFSKLDLKNGKHFKRLYIDNQENYLDELNDMVDCAITENIVIEKMEDGLYYSVMYRPEKKDMEKLQDIKREVKKPIYFNLNVFKNSNDLTILLS